MADTAMIGSIPTAFGTFGATLTPAGVGRLTFATEPLDECAAWARRWEPGARIVRDDGALAPLAAELVAYFAGELRVFTTPVDMRGTPFQVVVWRALADVPHGETRSYAQIAAAIGRPKAVRAVGAANGANPVPILTPCHRIIGSGGTLTGYAGGLALKERLLALEGTRPRLPRTMRTTHTPRQPSLFGGE